MPVTTRATPYAMMLQFRCSGCGAALAHGLHPFRCAAATAGDDIDHVLAGVTRRLTAAGREATEDANPFVRYRERLYGYAAARSYGLSDDDYAALARALDEQIARADGRGFVETPFVREDELAARLGFEEPGELWVKDETGNVSGSHKARHLAGIMLYLLAAERGGLLRGRQRLAIASCGNAALAAAVVASAARWPLEVFVPPSANAGLIARLSRLGAEVTACHRRVGVRGDPCYLAFAEAVASGAIPFCCQGSDNGLTIEGGETLAWEMADRLARLAPAGTGDAGSGSDRSAAPALDAVFVQVGGGALASSVVQGFGEAHRGGLLARLPAFYAVQTAGAFPLVRAFDLLVARILSRWPDGREPPASSPAELALAMSGEAALVADAMAFARQHRSQFMWPWDEEPRSVAHGILDDETYDWAAIVEGMLQTGGRALIVDEARLEEANAVARMATAVDVDHTGSAGLAGLMDALEQEPQLRRSRVALIFSGVRRA